MKKEIKEGFKITLENETFKLTSGSIYPKQDINFNVMTKERSKGNVSLTLDDQQLSDLINILSELKKEIEERQNPQLAEEKKGNTNRPLCNDCKHHYTYPLLSPTCHACDLNRHSFEPIETVKSE
jgi:hypothetical protein